MEKIFQKLKSQKLKVTPQRIAIYKFLCDTNTHPTAEIIYTSLKELNPSISIATVYKTLTTLKKACLIQELNLNDSSIRYDANTNFHSHLICTCCKSVCDYPLPHTIDINNDIRNKMGFSVEYTQLYFYGKCENCKNI